MRVRADGPDLGGRALGRRPGPDDRRQGDRRRAGRSRRSSGAPAFMAHWAPGTHTSTFMGDAVNLAAGLAAIGVLRDERPRRSAPRRSARGCSSGSGRRSPTTPHVGEVRGLGPVRRDRDRGRSRRPRRPIRIAPPRIRRAAFERGVLLGSGGHHENVIKLCPPLTIDERLLDTALELTIDTIRGTPMTQTAPSVIQVANYIDGALVAGGVGRDAGEPRPGDRRPRRGRAAVGRRGRRPGDRGGARRRSTTAPGRPPPDASGRRSCSSSPTSCARRPSRSPASSRSRWASRSATSASARSRRRSTASCSTRVPPG